MGDPAGGILQEGLLADDIMHSTIEFDDRVLRMIMDIAQNGYTSLCPSRYVYEYLDDRIFSQEHRT